MEKIKSRISKIVFFETKQAVSYEQKLFWKEIITVNSGIIQN
jgi:hypothetical protein